MRYTPLEVMGILTKARELGVSSLRIDGFEVSFQPKITLVPKVETESVIDHDFRLKGIGGSDAPVLMRMTPRNWSTPRKLWEIKTRRRLPDPPNYPMRRGLRLEPAARSRYEDMTGIEMPALRAIHPQAEFLRANADGVNLKQGRALEIKCPGREDHATAVRGEVPEKYVYQLVHILYVFDLDLIDYFSFDGKNGVVVPFTRKKALERKLIPEETRFWEHNVLKDIPPEDPEPKKRLDIFQSKKTSPFRVRRTAGYP